MRRAEVENLVGLKVAAIYRMMRTGDFPKPVRIGSKAVRWRREDIEAWIDSLPRASTD